MKMALSNPYNKDYFYSLIHRKNKKDQIMLFLSNLKNGLFKNDPRKKAYSANYKPLAGYAFFPYV